MSVEKEIKKEVKKSKISVVIIILILVVIVMLVILLYRYTINKTNLIDLEDLYEQYVGTDKYLDNEMVFTIDLPDNCRIKGTYKGDDFREIVASGSRLDKCSKYNYRGGNDRDEYTNKLIKDEIVDNIIEDLTDMCGQYTGHHDKDKDMSDNEKIEKNKELCNRLNSSGCEYDDMSKKCIFNSDLII